MRVKNLEHILVLFVLISAPLTGMMVEMHGAPEGDGSNVEDSATGGEVVEFGGMEEGMGRRDGGDVRDGESGVGHYDARGPFRSAASSAGVPTDEVEFGGSWFDDFKKMITEL